jgi:hypothetical protein
MGLLYRYLGHAFLTSNLWEMECLRRLIAGLSSPVQVQSRPIYVIFVLDELALGHDSVQVLLFSPVSIIPSTLHAHLFIRNPSSILSQSLWDLWWMK